MDFQQALKSISQGLEFMATPGPILGPVCVALFLLSLFVLRKPALRGACRLLGLDDAAVEKEVVTKIDAPLKAMILILAVAPFFNLAPASAGQILFKAVQFVAPFLFVHAVVQAFDLVFFRYMLARRRGINFPPVFRFLILAFLYLTTALVLLNWALGIDVWPLLATSTVITAVFGLALQDTLRNIFSGISITIEGSFRAGDWIMFHGQGGTDVVGRVIEIGWRCTRIHTHSAGDLFVPNSYFTGTTIVNFSNSAEGCPCELTIPVTLKLGPGVVKEALEAAAAKTEGVLAQPKPQAQPTLVRDDFIDYRLRFGIQDCENREEICGAIIKTLWERLRRAQMKSGEEKTS